MISVICVYNNEKILNGILLKSLKNQTAKFELIAIDNTNNRFKSASEALNYGGEKTGGDYLMFIHQDMWLGSDRYLEDAEKMLDSIPDIGIAGVAGMSDKGNTWEERVKYSINIFGYALWDRVSPVTKPEEVHTLDECLLIIPADLFKKLRFDETRFDGWDCYGADYCLCVRELGLKAYVIPGECSHNCLRASYELWEFKELPKYQKRMYDKHKKNHKIIYTWLGHIDRVYLIWMSYLSFFKPYYRKLFPDFQAYLKAELADCDSVLDLGCGHHSSIHKCGVKYSIGADIFYPSLQESSRLNIHNQYINCDIRKLEFKSHSFDAVIAIDVLQNLTKDEGIKLLSRMEQWAGKKIIIKTTNGYIKQDAYNNNPFQEHRSGWGSGELKNLGYKVHGIEGWKGWREIRDYQDYKDPLKYSFLRERISNLTQWLLYYYPQLGFELFAVKHIK